MAGKKQAGTKQAVQLGLAVAACLATFYFIWTDSTVRRITQSLAGLGGTQAPAAAPDAKPDAKAKAPDAKPVSVRKYLKHLARNSAAVKTRPLQPAMRPAVELVQPKARPPFPTARAIPVGTVRATLLGTFREPTLRASRSQEGILLETFVYLKEDAQIRTFVRLRNGRVVSTSTAVE